MMELYKILVDEYRFQVNLNWNRNKFYITLNATLIGFACGLFRIPGLEFTEILTLPLFFLGVIASFVGLKTLLKGIEYRRRIVLRMAEVEMELDIKGINTTAGIQEASSIQDKEAWIKRNPRVGSISFFLKWLYISILLLNILAIILIIFSWLIIQTSVLI